MFIVMFIFIGAFFIISQNNIALNSPENIGKFFETYSLWFVKIVDNAGSLTGYVIQMRWLPAENNTLSEI